MGTKCPTCGRDDFSSKKGMRTHHKLSHGESVTETITCEYCEESFEVLPYRVESENKKYCSSECQHSAQKRRTSSVCLECGSEFEHLKSEIRKFCSWGCRNLGLQNRVKSECKWCESVFEHRKSKDRKFCSVGCTERWFASEDKPTSNGRGEEHWAYRGGGGSKWYGPNWNDSKRIAKERVDECEHEKCSSEKDLQCHHIVPFRYFISDDGVDYESANDTENLMMVCPKHHTKMDARIRAIERADGYESQD